jgi:ABC-type Fe3+/spermidine/putrescine transport system ATPase subunit
MTLSSRIAVMEKGRFLQVGKPKEIYEYPCNRFVADFIGTINTFDGTVTAIDDDSISVRAAEAGCTLTALGKHDVAIDQAACIAVRPEKMPPRLIVICTLSMSVGTVRLLCTSMTTMVRSFSQAVAASISGNKKARGVRARARTGE